MEILVYGTMDFGALVGPPLTEKDKEELIAQKIEEVVDILKTHCAKDEGMIDVDLSNPEEILINVGGKFGKLTVMN